MRIYDRMNARQVRNIRHLDGATIEKAVYCNNQRYIILVLDEDRFVVIHGFSTGPCERDVVALKRNLADWYVLIEAGLITVEEGQKLQAELSMMDMVRQRNANLAEMRRLIAQYPDEAREAITGGEM